MVKLYMTVKNMITKIKTKTTKSSDILLQFNKCKH